MNEMEINALRREYAERIGDRLRRMREAAGYSQQELGWYVAKGYSIISRYENGKAPLPASDIPILAARCNRTPAYLFHFEDTQIHEECRAVQEAIRISYEMMEQIAVSDIDIRKREFAMPDTGRGGLSSSAIRRMSDTGTAVYMNRMGYITEEEMIQYMEKIQTTDYSNIQSIF